MTVDSWWQVGESGGYPGIKLSLWDIECAFCNERGNFSPAFHGEKKNPTTGKTLNFDVYKCENCSGYIHVLWSDKASGAPRERDQHDFHVLPWPLQSKPKPSENLSSEMARFWVQAHQTLRAEAWDACATMTRSALQLALRDHHATGRTLKDQIDEIASRGLLPPTMKEWAHEIRLLGNEAAHPLPDQPPPSPLDIRQAVEFMDFLLYCLYDLPAKIAQYRNRRTPGPT